MALDSRDFESRVPQAMRAMRVKSEVALELLAERTVRLMQERAPVGSLPQDVTGELRDGIHADPMQRTALGASITISSDAPYSAYVEFGTSKMPPQPFFRGPLHHAKIEVP